VWVLAFPIILSNLSTPLLGAVDTAVIGQIPDPAYLGGIAIGAQIFSIIYWGFGFLRMGTTGFTAQAYGAGDADGLRATLARAMILAVIIGAVLLVLQVPLMALALWAFDPGAKVAALTDSYLHIRIWSAPAALANYAILGWFIGVHNTRAALGLQIWMNGINIVLDLVFVIGLGWDVSGVALATVLAEYSAVALGLLLIARALAAAGGQWRRERILDPQRLRQMLAVNRDIFIRTLCLTGAFAFFTAQGSRLGVTVLAGNAVLMNFQTFMAYGLDGFAHATEALAGAAIGARRKEALRQAVKTSSIWAAMVAAGISVIYWLAGDAIVALLTVSPEVRAHAAEYMMWAVVSPLISVWSFQLDGIFIGATRAADMRNGMIISLVAYLAAAFVLVPLMGNHGLWLSLMVLMVARAVTLGLLYPRVERMAAV
jgi:MATE family multidrug resistance protein